MPQTPSDPLQTSSSGGDLIRRGLRFSHLRLMVALQETGQISSAAAQIAMTQPAASRLLAELETQMRAKLYERRPRGVALTEAGLLLANQARQVLQQLEDTGQKIARISGGTRGLVRIGAVTGPALEIVLPVIRQVWASYPEIELTVRVDTSDQLGAALLAHELDFYIGRVTEDIDPGVLKLDPIGPEPLDLIVRAEHPLSREGSANFADSLSYDWVVQPVGHPMRRTAELYILERGLELPRRILSTSSLLLTLAIISETDAVAPVARAVAEFYMGLAGRVQRLNLPHDMAVSPYSLIRRAEDVLSPAAERVFGLVRKNMEPIARPAGSDHI